MPVLASALELLLAAVETSSDLDVADAVPGVLLSLAATLGTGDWIGAAEASVETGAELLRLDEDALFSRASALPYVFCSRAHSSGRSLIISHT